MKANFIAALVASCILSLPVHAAIHPPLKAEAKVDSSTNKINLNTAELAKIIGSFKGVGKKRAQAVIDYRKKHDGIKSIEELAQVKGFGKHFVEQNHDKLSEIYSFK